MQIEETKVGPGRSATNVRASLCPSNEEKKKETLIMYTLHVRYGGRRGRHPRHSLCTLLNGPIFFLLLLPSSTLSPSASQVHFALVFANSYHLAIWTGQHGTGWDCIRLHLRRVEHLTLFLYFFFLCIFFLFEIVVPSRVSVGNSSEKGRYRPRAAQTSQSKRWLRDPFASVRRVCIRTYVCKMKIKREWEGGRIK